MRSPARALIITLLLAACTAAAPSDDADPSVPSEPPSSAPSVAPTVDPTPDETPEPSPSPAASVGPRELFGTWRTTLAGEPLSLNITESTYRIVRGSNSANGSVSMSGDQIEFFGSNLCAGTGVYRWTIGEDGALSFSPIETEPCDGRLEALLVRYPDYSPPSGG
jgi:hypothetical protein